MVALGIQNDALPIADVLATGAALHVQWVRIVTVPGQEGVADRIRAARGSGMKVILTVGGNGTSVQHISVKATLRWIDKLPRADKYTWTNEPDLVGPTPCIYRRRWMQLRRVLGKALLWGDTSPIKGLGFTKRAAACGHLPQPLPVAVHPYQASDPLAPGKWDLGIGSLPRARNTLAKLNVRVQWWITEFGYGPGWQHRECIDDQRAAWLWPRALAMASHVDARVLVIYTAKGPTWDTSLGDLALEAIRS